MCVEMNVIFVPEMRGADNQNLFCEPFFCISSAAREAPATLAAHWTQRKSRRSLLLAYLPLTSPIDTTTTL